MDEIIVIIDTAWDYFVLAGWLFVPVLLGMLVSYQGSPRLKKWTTAAVISILVLCLLEFFFPLQLEDFGTIGLWFRSIGVFFETMFFAIGMVSGVCFRRAVMSAEAECNCQR